MAAEKAARQSAPAAKYAQRGAGRTLRARRGPPSYNLNLLQTWLEEQQPAPPALARRASRNAMTKNGNNSTAKDKKTTTKAKKSAAKEKRSTAEDKKSTKQDKSAAKKTKSATKKDAANKVKTGHITKKTKKGSASPVSNTATTFRKRATPQGRPVPSRNPD